jgi:hypothetical protein
MMDILRFISSYNVYLMLNGEGNNSWDSSVFRPKVK